MRKLTVLLLLGLLMGLAGCINNNLHVGLMKSVIIETSESPAIALRQIDNVIQDNGWELINELRSYIINNIYSKDSNGGNFRISVELSDRADGGCAIKIINLTATTEPELIYKEMAAILKDYGPAIYKRFYFHGYVEFN